MNYTLQFGQAWPYVPYLLGGAWLSLQIAFLAFCGGMVIGLAGAIVKTTSWTTFGGRLLGRLTGAYVTFFTNTPQLVQIYFIFFALPDVGVLLSPYQAVLLGMTLNAGAYLTEVQRAGFLSVRREELDAAQALNMSFAQSLRYVIVPHIARVLFPPLSNQYILMTLGTSMAAVFGVEELTGRAFNANSETFRSIEIFSITAGLYILTTIVASTLLALAGRHLFRARMRIF